ncbi:MAG: ABC transporter permease, partial [Hyphomicrobiaceae bacterium]
MNIDTHPDRANRTAEAGSNKDGFWSRLRNYLTLTPINQRRWYNFKANRRGYWSLWVFLGVLVISTFADVIANDRPIIASYKGEILFPFLYDYPEEKIGGFLATIDYKEEFAREEFKQHGWMVWPLIRYSYNTVNSNYPRRKNANGDCLGFPSPPYPLENNAYCDADDAEKMKNFQKFGNRNWLGTDD